MYLETAFCQVLSVFCIMNFSECRMSARVRQLRSADTRCQSDAQQFWRQDLCRCRTTSLEQSTAQSQTMWPVIWPVHPVTGDIFIPTVRPRCSVNCFFNCAE